MKKILFLSLIASVLSVASFAAPHVKTHVRHITAAKVVKAKQVAFFPVTIETSCGTWTMEATCGGSLSDCLNGLNAIGDFLESLC